MPAFIEDEFSMVIYNHFGVTSKVKNGFQIPITLRGKTILDIQATISLKDRRFDEKGAWKSTSAGSHIKPLL